MSNRHTTVALAVTSALVGIGAGYVAGRCWNKKRSGQEKWVAEGSDFEGVGLRTSFHIERLLHEEHSGFQKIQIYETKNFGNLMVLDNVFQNTEADEFAYHEMITHVPLFCHLNPKRVLVIGGGDCGAIREALKHKSVEEIHLVEIDKRVTDLSRMFFKDVVVGADDPKVTLKYECGDKYLATGMWDNYYDVIICDSSDPIGPNQPLFSREFYQRVSNALTEKGIAVFQGECMWLHPKTIKSSMSECSQIFSRCEYYNISIPVYPCGTIGFIACAKSGETELREVSGARAAEAAAVSESLKYYSPQVHAAAFQKPRFFSSNVHVLRNLN